MILNRSSAKPRTCSRSFGSLWLSRICYFNEINRWRFKLWQPWVTGGSRGPRPRHSTVLVWLWYVEDVTLCSRSGVVYQGQQTHFTPLEGRCRHQIMMMTQMNYFHSSGGRMLTTNNDDVDPNELWFKSTDVHPPPTTAAHLLRRSLLLQHNRLSWLAELQPAPAGRHTHSLHKTTCLCSELRLFRYYKTSIYLE